ncbi:hypothetical protein Acsp05_33440 [Actinokineospora sp. NBRC 105648]|nr:hypothetical protein Acsp05_33440 [Actinokineospora sp. NBRC 105648]
MVPVSGVLTGAGGRAGVIQILWSPRCQTNWGRIVLDSYDPNPNHLPRWVDVHNAAGGHVYFTWTGAGQYIYGDMLYSPGCAWATGYVDRGGYANAWGGTGQAC